MPFQIEKLDNGCYQLIITPKLAEALAAFCGRTYCDSIVGEEIGCLYTIMYDFLDKDKQLKIYEYSRTILKDSITLKDYTDFEKESFNDFDKIPTLSKTGKTCTCDFEKVIMVKGCQCGGK